MLRPPHGMQVGTATKKEDEIAIRAGTCVEVGIGVEAERDGVPEIVISIGTGRAPRSQSSRHATTSETPLKLRQSRRNRVQLRLLVSLHSMSCLSTPMHYSPHYWSNLPLKRLLLEI